MNRNILYTLVISVIVGTISGYVASSMNKIDNLEKHVAKYINNNPQTILDSVENYQIQQEKEQQANVKKALPSAIKKLKAMKNIGFVGNENSTRIAYKFYDFNCGYCKKSYKDIANMIQNKYDMKIYMVPFPILGRNSIKLANLAQYIQEYYPDKFEKIVQNVMMSRKMTDEQIKKMLVDNQISSQQASKIIEAINDNSKYSKDYAKIYEITSMLKISGTPAFIIGNEMVGGYVTEAELKKLLENNN